MHRICYFLLLTLISLPCYHVAAQSTTAVPATTISDSSWRLTEGDMVRLEIYQEPDLATQTKILKTGEASFPLVGTVQLGGLTVAEATEKLRTLYDADYLVNPKLILSIDSYAQQFVTILGAVTAAGRVAVPSSGNLDLATAIASVGGLSATADPQQIQVTRANGTSTTYSYAAIQDNRAPVPLGPGDRVLIGQSAFVGKTITIMGEVRTRGQLAFPIDGKLDLLTAIARAGGFTELANPKKVTIVRRGDSQIIDARKLSEKGAAPFMLEPDDIITVAERMF